MNKHNELFKSKVNRLYFIENKTVTDISVELNVPYNSVLSAIERGDFYRFRNGVKTSKNNKEAINIISDAVSEYYGLKERIINKKTSIREVVVPRQIAQTIAYNLTKSSNAFIGMHIGSVIPCTVTHSREVINGLLSYNNNTRDAYLDLEQICKVKLKDYRNATDNKSIS